MRNCASAAFSCSDDGNVLDGDGCSFACAVESGWTCSGGSYNTPDVCADGSQIRYALVPLYSGDQFANYDANNAITYELLFSKQFSLPAKANLIDFLRVAVVGDSTAVRAEVLTQAPTSRRALAASGQDNSTFVTYWLLLYPASSLVGRQISVGFANTSAFTDRWGNTLQAKQSIAPVGVYLYVSEDARQRISSMRALVEVFGYVAMLLALLAASGFLIGYVLLVRPFVLLRDNARVVLTEALTIVGAVTLLPLVGDNTENEEARLQQQWYAIYALVAALAANLVLSLLDVFMPFLALLYHRLTRTPRAHQVVPAEEVQRKATNAE